MVQLCVLYLLHSTSSIYILLFPQRRSIKIVDVYTWLSTTTALSMEKEGFVWLIGDCKLVTRHE